MIRIFKIPVGALRVAKECHHQRIFTRGMVESRQSLILGTWECCNKNKLTEAAEKFDLGHGGVITKRFLDTVIKKGQVQLAHDIGGYYVVALCGIGPEGLGIDDQERLHECRENVRRAAAVGVHKLIDQEVGSICVDPMSCPDAAAEGAKLAAWVYQDYKSTPKLPTPEINVFSSDPNEKEVWDRGSIMADGQNVARLLSEWPANVMTPRRFAEEAIKILCPCGVHVNVRNLRWIEDHKMFAFLNMAKGSCQPPYFLEINYCGGAESDRPVVLCGKGVTFDSGGICLKKCKPKRVVSVGDMPEQRASCTGAAAIVGAIKAMARLGVPANVVGLIPLFENMPGGSAMKPGDVLMALNGRTIVVEDTDNESRVALADVLTYSDNFKPCLDAVIGNMTAGSRAALGTGATVTFSSSQVVWEELDKAGAITGDRVWRFPLWKNYKHRVTLCPHVDTCNTGRGHPDSSACLAAAFLSEFVPDCDFLQLDTTGTGMITRGTSAPYLRRGFMTGRPTRTIAQFINNMACPLDAYQPCSGK